MNKVSLFVKQGIKSLKRERFFAGVNVLGLSLGFFCFIITALYVTDELTHDKWHKNADSIYLPLVTFDTPQGSMSLMPPYAIGDAWVEDSPGVIASVNLSEAKKKNYLINEQSYETSLLHFSEPSLFDVFDFELVIGDETMALADPDNLIISENLAKKHYGNTNPLGQLIEIEGYGTMKVSGVLKEIPSNSHIQMNMILPIDHSRGDYEGLENNWNQGHGMHYVLLEPNYSIEKLKEDTKRIIEKNKEGAMTDYKFSQFSQLYLNGHTWRNDNNVFGGQMKYIYIFAVIGVLMLLVASFNYINLTTSRSFARAKDFAVRKIVGAGRARLVRLQMGETFFLALIAAIIAIVVTEILLPTINGWLGKDLTLSIFADPVLLAMPLGILTALILASGLYPAIVGSRFNMVQLLKGQNPRSKGQMVRKGLIVLQFVICAGLLSSAFIIRSQADHLINIDLGYQAENVASLDMAKGDMFGKYEEFKTELSRNPQIEFATGSPFPSSYGAMIFNVGEEGSKQRKFVSFGSADEGFVEMFGLEMLSGQSFADVLPAERAEAVILNEAALTLWGFDKETVIGQTIPDSGFKVVGVVKDFHFRSARAAIAPLMISYNPTQIRNMSVKFRAGEKEEVLAYVNEVWENLGATAPLVPKMVDGYFDTMFEKEQTLVAIFDLLTFMLGLVAFLGLFAMATFESQLKEKELSIRKVLGANYLTLIKSLNVKFILLIAVAMVISIPATQYLISSWLDAFPYRIESTMPYYIKTACFVLVLAISLLSVHGLRSARKNPVDILRND